METFDLAIVGAGSAGCVLAEQLSASGRYRVLLIERGPRDRSPWIHMPAGYGKLFYHPHLNYGLHAEPSDALAGRRDYWPRGRVVGGSGAINAMVYCRGLPADFDDWQAAGATGWSWQSVAETYAQIETRQLPGGGQQGDGPVHVASVADQVHPVNRHFFDAAAQLGLPQTPDLNGETPEGAATYPVNIRQGRRWSSAQSHLRPALKRANLELRSDTQVRRVLFEGAKVVGLELQSPTGAQKINVCNVILAAGAIHSPQLLQLSGIGPAALLRGVGIPVLQANKNVGGNLQDHLGISYFFRANEPTLNNQLAPWSGKLWAGLRYLLARRGPLALSVNQCGGFFRSNPGLTRPDQQLYFNPVTYTTTRQGTRNVIHPDPFAGFIIGMQPCRPSSRGRIDIVSKDPDVPPKIISNALSTQEDVAGVVAGARLCARLLQTPALKGLIEAPLYQDLRQMDEDQMLEDFRARCGSVFHPVSTCRMGSDPKQSVVDPGLRVHGVEGLHVADASVFPSITSGNTNAPTMMLAHRAAGLILQQLG